MPVQSCSKCFREGSPQQLMRCSRCKTSVYCVCPLTGPLTRSRCSPTAQPTASASSMSLRPSLRRAPPSHGCSWGYHRGAPALQTSIIHPSHPIYHCGLPNDPSNMIRHPGLDNQTAMHLLTQPSTGSPDSKWGKRAGCIGTVSRNQYDET
ncbi:hypothetical protein F5141DRAFT_1159712, partial [Pisolithus sp. B1]